MEVFDNVALLCCSRKTKKLETVWLRNSKGEGNVLKGGRQQGGLDGEVNTQRSQSERSPLPDRDAVFTHLCPQKLPESQVTGGMLGQSHLPFCSQVPCWILKDYMMKKCALQITYRSMQFLILPHPLDNSLKSQFITC